MDDRLFIFNVDDADRLKDCILGMGIEDLSFDEEDKQEKQKNDKMNDAYNEYVKIIADEVLTEKIDIIRKAYLFDLYMLQNKYGKYMNDTVNEYKNKKRTNDKSE